MSYKEVMRRFATSILPCLALCSLLAPLPTAAAGRRPAAREARSQSAAEAPPVLLTPAQLEGLLPASVYFRGKSAPIQLRNAAGVRFGAEGYVLAAIVDSAGYASSVQETYQLYLITERALTLGGKTVPPGAYGAGVVNGSFLLMDVGGHTLLQVDAAMDKAMQRPRPLQMVLPATGGARLYLGRFWVPLAASASN